MKILYKLLIILFLITNFANGEQIYVFKFTEEEFETLQKKKLKEKLFGH